MTASHDPPTRPDRFDGRRVVVAGAGISGRAAATVLLRLGARVLVVDERDDEPTVAGTAALVAQGAEIRLGDATSPVDAELIVTSPGWRPAQPMLAAAATGGIEVIGEPELAWRLRPPHSAPWVAVTGTNGKTTTVGMVEAILQAAGYRAIAAGNVGLPLLDAVLDPTSFEVIAVELSSFQLHWSVQLAPEVGTVLNIAADHLDWHGSMAAYGADKAAVWRAGGCGVYNADDELVSSLAVEALDDPHPFTMGPPASGGLGIADGAIVDAMSGWAPESESEPPYVDSVDGNRAIRLVDLADLTVSGPHNVANAIAAAAACRVFGLQHHLPWRAVGEGLRAYRPGHHRNELVAEGAGVSWVDDSKATNPHAAAASLSAYPSVVWIAGGLLKGADIEPLVVEHAERLRGAVLIGQDRSAIAEALARHAPDVPVVTVETDDTSGMEEAVRRAADLARSGDTVLLAPAAASMDMFTDYAQRGELFAAAAQRVAGTE